MANHNAPSYGSAAGFREHAQRFGNPQKAKGNRRFSEAHPCRSAQNDAGTGEIVCREIDTAAQGTFSVLPHQSGRSV